MSAIRYFDMFAGIGGFRTGLTRAGGFECIGHCEIDPHADKAYRAIHNISQKEVFYRDAKQISGYKLPDFDLICAGFPCQSFSIAGKRRGFTDKRGTLFFDIARILAAKHPPFLFLENVPGLLNHDGGRTFKTILDALFELGYYVEWQVLNSKDFGVPQSRKRVYIIGYLDPRCAGKILPIGGANGQALIQVVRGSQSGRVYDSRGLARTQTAGRNPSGLYLVDIAAGSPKTTETARCLTSHCGNSDVPNRKGERSGVLLIKEATKKGFKEAVPGDSVDLSYAGGNTHRGRVGHNIAHTLKAGDVQGIIERGGRIRRLMPRECLRLQGFDDEQIDKLLAVTSDSQAYKQAGNAVTANVIEAIGKRIRLAADTGKERFV